MDTVVDVAVREGAFVPIVGSVVFDRGDDGSGDALSFVQPARDPAATTAMAIATRWNPVMPRRAAALSSAALRRPPEQRRR